MHFLCSPFATQELCGLLIHISGSNFPIRFGRRKEKYEEGQQARGQHEVLFAVQAGFGGEAQEGGTWFLKGDYFNAGDGELNSGN